MDSKDQGDGDGVALLSTGSQRFLLHCCSLSSLKTHTAGFSHDFCVMLMVCV